MNIFLPVGIGIASTTSYGEVKFRSSFQLKFQVNITYIFVSFSLAYTRWAIENKTDVIFYLFEETQKEIEGRQLLLPAEVATPNLH